MSDPADWRGHILEKVRGLFQAADPDIIEEQKWKKPSNPAGVPTWSCAGVICTGETYKNKVKLTFAQGASLDDPSGLFNSSLEGGTRRAIDIFEGDNIDASALTGLVQSAVAFNKGRSSKAR